MTVDDHEKQCERRDTLKSLVASASRRDKLFAAAAILNAFKDDCDAINHQNRFGYLTDEEIKDLRHTFSLAVAAIEGEQLRQEKERRQLRRKPRKPRGKAKQ